MTELEVLFVTKSMGQKGKWN